jgi:NADH-quinone oxidoreductase subunit A
LVEYVGVLLMVALAVAFTGALLLVNLRLAPRRARDARPEPYAGGGLAREAPRRRFAVRFHAVAILFLVFDVVVVLLLPWSAVLRELGRPALVSMSGFVAPIAVGLAYAWGRGTLRW